MQFLFSKSCEPLCCKIFPGEQHISGGRFSRGVYITLYPSDRRTLGVKWYFVSTNNTENLIDYFE